MNIVIDGWWGSGKSTLRGLLDGHPRLFVCPVQESFFGGVSTDKKSNEWLSDRDVVGFRKTLCGKTDYSRIEREALQSRLVNTASGSSFNYINFEFDFNSFDKTFVSKVFAQEVWSLEEIGNLLYRTMADFWPEYPGERNEFTAMVSMDNNYPDTADFIASSTKVTKYIWVDRDSEGILATHARRRPVKGFVGTKDWGSKSIQDFIDDGEVVRIEAKRKKMAKWAREMPDKFLVVSFDSMIMQTARVMDEVSTFLGIERLPVLDRYTYCGRDFPGSENYVGVVNDSPEKAFQSDDLKALRAEVERVRNLVPGDPRGRGSRSIIKRAATALIRRIAK